METAGLIVGSVGAIASLVASVWLLVGFKPDNPRYVDDGMLYPGRQTSTVLPSLLRDQRHVAAVVVIGATLQFVGVLMALAARA